MFSVGAIGLLLGRSPLGRACARRQSCFRKDGFYELLSIMPAPSRAQRDTSASLPGMGGLLPPPKMPPKENPWVQDPCKHPSVLPYPAPPKVIDI